MSEMVKGRIISDMEKGRLHRIINKASLYCITGKQVAAAVFVSVIAITALFNFNPQAKAWAEKTANEVKNSISFTFSGGGSTYTQSIVQDPAVDSETRVLGYQERFYMPDNPADDIKDLESMTGFKVKLPGYLPSGYTIPDKVSVLNCDYKSDTIRADKSLSESSSNSKLQEGITDGTQKLALINLISAKDQADGICILSVSNNKNVNLYGIQGEQVTISNITATLSKEYITYKNDEQNEGRDATMNILQWKDGNVFYRISDCTGLSVDELVKVAESIIKEP
jgi:hypothetical protein